MDEWNRTTHTGVAAHDVMNICELPDDLLLKIISCLLDQENGEEACGNVSTAYAFQATSRITDRSLDNFEQIDPFLQTCTRVHRLYFAHIQVICIDSLQVASKSLKTTTTKPGRRKALLTILRHASNVKEILLPPASISLMKEIVQNIASLKMVSRCSYFESGIDMIRCFPHLKQLDIGQPTNISFAALAKHAPRSLRHISLQKVSEGRIRDLIMTLQSLRYHRVNLKHLFVELEKKGTRHVHFSDRNTMGMNRIEEETGEHVVFYINKKSTNDNMIIVENDEDMNTLKDKVYLSDSDGDGDDEKENMHELVKYVATYMLLYNLVESMTISTPSCSPSSAGNNTLETPNQSCHEFYLNSTRSCHRWAHYLSKQIQHEQSFGTTVCIVDLILKHGQNANSFISQIQQTFLYSDGRKYQVLLADENSIREIPFPVIAEDDNDADVDTNSDNNGNGRVRYLGCDLHRILTPIFLYGNGDLSMLRVLEIGDVRSSAECSAYDFQQFKNLMTAGTEASSSPSSSSPSSTATIASTSSNKRDNHASTPRAYVTHVRLKDPVYVMKRASRANIYRFHLKVTLTILQAIEHQRLQQDDKTEHAARAGCRILDIHVLFLSSLFEERDMDLVFTHLRDLYEINLFGVLVHREDTDDSNDDDEPHRNHLAHYEMRWEFDTTPFLKLLPTLLANISSNCRQTRRLNMFTCPMSGSSGGSHASRKVVLHRGTKTTTRVAQVKIKRHVLEACMRFMEGYQMENQGMDMSSVRMEVKRWHDTLESHYGSERGGRYNLRQEPRFCVVPLNVSN